MLTNEEWLQFFSLLDKIVDADGLSADEKAKTVRDRARNEGEREDGNLDEFTSWNFGY